MVKYTPRFDLSKSTPPNSYYDFLTHPSGKSDCLELALFCEHRFAFYYWIKWSQEKNLVPDLVTFDWHTDLAYPTDEEKKELSELNLSNLYEVSLFSWARLDGLNDTHIMSAAYLNQLNDIWVVCKQNVDVDTSDEIFTDAFGNKHTIRKFANSDDLFKKMGDSKILNVYFDIDVDYFTVENNSTTSYNNQKFTYVKDSEIKAIFNPNGELMQWIFQRMCGFTIALEPECTGGILKSMKYLRLINNIFFDGEILNEKCKWKHLMNNLI